MDATRPDRINAKLAEVSDKLRVFAQTRRSPELAALLGVAYGGDRDIFRSAGYPQSITTRQYREAYRRQDIARRIVRAKPDETWRVAPDVLDGLTVDKGSDRTRFAKEWRRIAQEIGVLDDADASKGVLHYLHRLDVLCGVGRYACLLLGLRDGKQLSEPVEPGSAGIGGLLYLSVFDEDDAQIATWVTDETDPRFGLPESYKVNLAAGEGAEARVVHWTRLIHVAEEVGADDVFGTPRLEAVWNRLFDLLKILAGSAEAAWKLLDAGHMFTTQPGHKLPAADADMEELENRLDDFAHNLDRMLLVEGMDVKTLGGAVSDPTGLVNVNLDFLAATTGIPKRILMGSERGELASSQDESNWTKQIETRQANFAGPMILRPTIRRLIYAGVLPRPSSGDFCFRWPPLSDVDTEAQARTLDLVATALQKLSVRLEPKPLLEAVTPGLASIPILEDEPEPVEPPPAPASMSLDDSEPQPVEEPVEEGAG